MKETAQEMIRFYEELKAIGICSFIVCFFAAVFLMIKGKLWTTIKTLKNERKKTGKRKKLGITALIMTMSLFIGEKMILAQAEETEQTMEISATVPNGEWFRGEGEYVISIRVRGRKPDKVYVLWNEAGQIRTEEWQEAHREEENCWEYQMILDEEEMESKMQIFAVTGQETICMEEWEVKIDKKPPIAEVTFHYQEGEKTISKKWGDISETLYFQREVRISCYVKDEMSGVAEVHFLIGEFWTEAMRGEAVQIDGEKYDTYHLGYVAPFEGTISAIRLIDVAGNEKILLGEEQERIVVDQTAPVCLPFILEEAKEREGIYFFNDYAQIKIQIQEKHWREQNVPVFINTEEAEFVNKTWEKISEDLYQNLIVLEKEGVYFIEIGPIFDCSENKMEKTKMQKVVIDQTPPVLQEYEIEADGNFEGGSWYTNSGKVKGKIKIKENWFDPDRMKLFMINQETKEEWNVPVRWKQETGEIEGNFQTEEIKAEGIYCFGIEGTDLAGNPVMFDTEQKSIFFDTLVIVDRTAPKISDIEWEEKKREENETLYFQMGIKGEISVEEKGRLKKWEIFEKREGEDWKPVTTVWKEEEKRGEFTAEKTEGRTQLLVVAEDLAGNCLCLSENILDFQETEEGIVSKNLVIDRTKPKVEIFYYTAEKKPITIEQWQTDNKIKRGELKIKIRIREENFDPAQWKFEMYACDKKGYAETSQEKSVISADKNCKQWMEQQKRKDGWKQGEWYETEWTFSDEANYKIKIQMRDFSQNCAVFEEENQKRKEECYESFFTIDQTAPVFIRAETQYRKEDQTILEKYHYRDYPYFSDQKVNIFLKARDTISGVKLIRFQLAEAENQIWTTAKQIEKGMDEIRCLIEVPVDFTGEIWVQAVDEQGIIGEKEKIDAVLIQTKEQGEKSSVLKMTEEERAYLQKDGIRYYPGDISILIRAEDPISGIKKIQCLVNGEVWTAQEYTKQESRVFQVQKRLELTQQIFGEESITVQVEMETNSGYRITEVRKYLIDSENPVITVTYEKGEGKGNFDRTERMAQITVSDRNLDYETLKLWIDSTEGKSVRQSVWEMKEGKKEATCSVLFEEEDTYRITVSASDCSGNQSEMTEEAFTIDYTEPEIIIKKDLRKGKTDTFYRGGGKITIFIKEKNFDPEGIFLELSGTSEDGEQWKEEWKEIWNPVEGGYQSIKKLEREGNYLLYMRCEDLAGNQSREYGPDRFVIDKTVPEIIIEQTKENSANNGRIEPVIYLYDPYLDAESLEISCIGEKWGEKKLTYAISDDEKRKKVSIYDFPYEKKQDDLYTMRIRIRDKAGNLAGKKICFSVNRFGSVYTFEEETKQFLETYYQKEAKTLKIIETNVDSLEENEILCSRDGETKQMKKGTEYKVGIQGEKGSWKQYIYEIYSKNFQEEGIYQLTLISKDQAGNYSDNGKNGEEIMFVIDHSAPTAVISGIEENGRYKEKEHRVWIDAADNIGIKKVMVFLNGALWKEWEQEEWKEKAELLLKEKETKQTFSVKIEDLAGNHSTYTIRDFLICHDSWIQFWNSYQKWVIGVIISGSLAISMTAAKKWKKRQTK